jgi:hypothetical protein
MAAPTQADYNAARRCLEATLRVWSRLVAEGQRGGPTRRRPEWVVLEASAQLGDLHGHYYRPRSRREGMLGWCATRLTPRAFSARGQRCGCGRRIWYRPPREGDT